MKEKLTLHTEYRTNPFEVYITTRKYTIKGDEELKLDKETGELYIHKELPEYDEIKHDPEVYTKIFKGKAKQRLKLSEPTRRMFDYLIENLKPGSDTITIILEEYLEFAEYSLTNKQAYYAGLNGLLNANIIARQEAAGNCYFINPNILFNGDRRKLPIAKVVNLHDARISNQNSE